MTFDERFYLQIQGIAMGKIFAPTYAALSMGFHEIEPYAIIRNKFTLPVSNYFEQNWERFLYDCFIFLGLSMETSDSQFPFLDIMINKEGKKISMESIQNQRIQKGMSPSNQTTPEIA